jgi:hypothetical protein
MDKAALTTGDWRSGEHVWDESPSAPFQVPPPNGHLQTSFRGVNTRPDWAIGCNDVGPRPRVWREADRRAGSRPICKGSKCKSGTLRHRSSTAKPFCIGGRRRFFFICAVAPSTQSGGEVMLFCRHAATTTVLNLSQKQRTALQFHFLVRKSLVLSIPCGNALLEEASLGWR